MQSPGRYLRAGNVRACLGTGTGTGPESPAAARDERPGTVLPRLVSGIPPTAIPDTTSTSATKSAASELAAALASVRIHLNLTRRPGAEEFAASILWKAADINKIPGRKYSASHAQFYAVSV